MDLNMSTLTAPITRIQRYSVHDGPGIRTVVFFKGCPLACKWCQNPETQSVSIDLMLNPELCIGCSACVNVCPQHKAKTLLEDRNPDRSACVRCGSCSNVCYSGAREMNGVQMTVQQVLSEVNREAVFYKNSGGGLTVSGGEPLMHSKFVRELFLEMKRFGVSTAIETCGYAPWKAIEEIVELTDTFLFDVKALDPEVHERFTGKRNELILKNLKKIAARGANIVLRFPLIPGVNDNQSMYEGLAQLAKELNIKMVHIMPFHQMGSSKWDGMGMDYSFRDTKPLSMDVARAAETAIAAHGIEVHIFGY